MQDEGVVYYEDLATQFGIKLSRTHLARLEKAGKFPQRLKPLKIRGSRFFYLRQAIRDWIRGSLK
jgi:hypothetical protein